MASISIRQCLSFLVVVLSLIFLADGNLQCENITVANILRENSFPVKPQKNFIALCINGYEAVSLQSVCHIWSSVQVAFKFNPTGAKYREADSCIDLQPANHTLTSAIQSFVVGGNALDKTTFYLSPFKITCLGIRVKEQQDNYRISAVLKAIDWRFPAAFLLGLIIFYNADRLSRNSVFFYSSGVTLGVLLSLLLFVYVLHKFIPKRAGAYAILLGGWSIVAFVIQWTVSNFKELLLSNNQWVIGYILVAGVISFSVCYYYGPVTSDRGLDLIRWALQIAGLILLYMGTRSEEVSLAVVVTALLSYFIGSRGFVPAILRMLPRQW